MRVLGSVWPRIGIPVMVVVNSMGATRRTHSSESVSWGRIQAGAIISAGLPLSGIVILMLPAPSAGRAWMVVSDFCALANLGSSGMDGARRSQER